MVEVFTTDTCPYCVQAKRLLQHQNIPYVEYNVNGLDGRQNYQDMRHKIGIDKKPTVPQIFFGEYHVGGFTELRALKRNKTLHEMVKEHLGDIL